MRIQAPFLSLVALLVGILFQFQISSAQDNPLKVYILVGQSNMQGHAHVRTLEHLRLDESSKTFLDRIQNADGTAIQHDDIYISYLSSKGTKQGKLTTGFGADENKIGPELTFGIYMQQKLGEPILLIKTAWGGKSINTDFRPPSAGPYPFDSAQLRRFKEQNKDVNQIKADKAKATGVYYRLTLEHIKSVLADIQEVYPDYDNERGYEISGMVWFQGWNDMVDGGSYPKRNEAGGYDKYSSVLRHLIRDFRRDLNTESMPFVIGVMGVGGPTAKYGPDQKRYQKIHQYFRDAMAAPANDKEFERNVFVVRTEEQWDLELDGILRRDNQIKSALRKQQKEGSLAKSDFESTLTKLREKEFSPNELEILRCGASNAAFHYLGSSKIMCGIGKAFAEAMPVSN